MGVGIAAVTTRTVESGNTSVAGLVHSENDQPLTERQSHELLRSRVHDIIKQGFS